MMYFHTKKQEGFTLVETLVAISILLIVIVGPMSISSRTAKSSSFATEQIQAFYLAQEGLELAQKVRDDFLLQQFTTPPNTFRWTAFLASPVYTTCLTSTGCGLSWSTSVNGPVESVACNLSTNACTMFLSTIDRRSRLSHDSGSGAETPFNRRIYFQVSGVPGLDNRREVKVRSVVTWRTGSIIANQVVEMDTYLYNTYASP
jgi:prepilin-type N-terminal cleavage/methylation domain-containing protein